MKVIMVAFAISFLWILYTRGFPTSIADPAERVLDAAAGAGADAAESSPASPDGVVFTVPGVTEIADLNGDPVDPDLTVFFGGNQFMALPELIAAFQKKHPEVRNIFYETLPPGIIEKQLKSGRLTMGNLTISARPDLFVAGKELTGELERDGWVEPPRPYMKNRLAIMVAAGNPKAIRTYADLGRDDVRVSMPNPQTEGVAEKIMTGMEQFGGQALVRRVMELKQEDGSTFVTQIHHRETPQRILAQQSDAGPVWETEVLYQLRIGSPVERVAIEDRYNVSGTTAAAILKNAPHRRAAELFLEFITGAEAARIYQGYGFTPLHAGE